uniref:NS2 n=1 Tax=uncultured densovirus TaxID=748192 RepID=A0A7L7YQG0_9VIRU|nr:NS2 [uncultured densovirus]
MMTDQESTPVREDSSSEEEEEVVKKYSMNKVMQLIMGSLEGVSQDPRYLLYLKNYLGNETDLNLDLQLVLPHLSNVARYLLKNEKSLMKKGYIELLNSCEKAKVLTSQMYLDADLLKELMRLVKDCNVTQEPSVESFSSLVPTEIMSTLSTTAPARKEHADASSSRKRKTAWESDDDDDLFGEDLFAPASLPPTYETSSSIFLREGKGAKLKTSKCLDEWRDSKFKLVQWKTEDLSDIRQEDEWRHARKTMTLNYSSTSPEGLIITECIRGLEKKTKRHLKENDGRPIDFNSKRKRF